MSLRKVLDDDHVDRCSTCQTSAVVAFAWCVSPLPQLVYGHVDLDESDGEVRYKTSADFGKATDIKPIVQNFMNLHVGAGKTYLKALQAMKDDGASVKSVLGRLSIDDYGPSDFCSSTPLLTDADLEQALISSVRRTPPTRQQSQDELAALLNALGLGR